MTMRLRFSIGPVQGFVAESRTTRDLQVSSYLLSLLSGFAMRGAVEAGAKIVQPTVDDDPLFRRIVETPGDAPSVGSLPNVFEADCDGDARAVAGAAVSSMNDAWKKICDAVWRRFVEPVADLGEGTEKIWQRQVEGFWEVMWVAAPVVEGRSEAGSLLARRKEWRTHAPPAENGDKCSVMPDLQELSGYVRTVGGDEEKKRLFWEALREGVRKPVGGNDVRENERLSAIALVKRLFPRVAKEAIGWDVGMKHGTSTTHLAAEPWRKKVTDGDYRDWKNLVDEYDDADDRRRKELSKDLRALGKRKGGDGKEIGLPSGFFALLLADGDKLGELLRKVEREKVSRALLDFSTKVQPIVDGHDGVTLYAGGDDLLALLPLPGALSCARTLNEVYRGCFDNNPAATLSAAVVFAPIAFPLAEVVRAAHKLLDDIAKEANGRDSLAVEVLKGGGTHCKWVSTWERGEKRDAVALVEEVASDLKKGADGERSLSSGVVHRARETLSLLCGNPRWTTPGVWSTPEMDVPFASLLHAAIARSTREKDEKDDERSARERALAGRVAALCAEAPNVKRSPRMGFDGVLLAHFIAGGGHEEGHE